MANQVWGKHATYVTGDQDSSKQVSKNEWNESLNRKGLLGFDAETIASASEVTIPADTSGESSDGSTSSFIKLSGVADVDKFITTNTSEGDLLWVITTGSATLVNVSSPSASEIRLLADDDKDLSTTVPTILMRVGTAWYEYGGGTVSDGSVTNAKLADMAANTIKVRNANSTGVPSDIALATTQLLIGDGTGFTAAALSGDVSMDNTGDVTVGTLNQSTTGNAATATLATNVTTNANLTGGVTSSGNAATVITNANLTGGVTSVGNAATVVTNANLTGGVTSSGNAATVITNANLTGGVTSVGNAATVVTNANLTGDVTSSGNATTIATSAVDIAMLSATGTASSSTFLRGDNSWQSAGGGAVELGEYKYQANGYTTPSYTTRTVNDSSTPVELWVKDIDASGENQGVFIRIKKNDAYEDVQLG